MSVYVYVYGSIVEPSGFRVLGFVVALGVPFNKQHPLSQKTWGLIFDF